VTIHSVVLGASGYVGGELLRLLCAHPAFELSAAVSASFAGKPVGEVFPHLADACAGATFSAPGGGFAGIPNGSDVALFSAMPHGASAAAIAAALAAAAERSLNMHVVDSSADFRLGGTALFETVYGNRHPAPALFDLFDCAVPEHAPATGAAHIGHPGCFATAALLAAVPLVEAGLVEDDLYLCGITGSTGSGRNAQAGTHHPERHSNLYAYKPLAHRHAPEIRHLVARASGRDVNVHFVPHSGPFARGIHMTLQAPLATPAAAADVVERYREYYAGSPFVRVVDGQPRLKDVVASNRALIGAAVDARTVTAFCVIDNLVKGAAGGAMQWMNRLWSLPEATGLGAAPPAWT